MLSIRKIGVISRTYRNLNRYRRILTILFKYGFGDLIDLLKIEQTIEVGLQLISRNKRQPPPRHSRAVRTRMALEELGPTFIKLGQILSTRPDLIPVDFIDEFAKLQDQVPPSRFEHIQELVASEFGASADTLFECIETDPFASASIGQVHNAVTADGEKVAVKIQRPGIRKIIEVDLEILLHMATLMERHIEEMALYRPVKIVEEFARILEKELDYTIEAGSMERMAAAYLGNQTVYIPKVYRELTSSRVLTMEYVQGIKISEIDELDAAGLDREQITRRGARFYLNQIFGDGFFHADPHPGNILVLPENVICLLDFGMMGSINDRTREDFVDLVDGVVNRRPGNTVRVLLRLTEWDHEPDINALEKDALDFMDRHLYKPLKDIEIGKILNQLLDLASHHQLRIPPDTFLMMKALATIEGVATALDPGFNMVDATIPFIEKIKLDRFRPTRIATDAMRFGSEFIRFMDRFPKDLLEITRQLKQQQITFRLEHQGLKTLLAAHNQISNRIAFSIIIAALLIGSALIVISKTPPLFYGISLIGIIGFLFAAVMGIWLMVAILRKGSL